MGLKRTDEFRQDAVRIALTSGLTLRQVADDLGVRIRTCTVNAAQYRVDGATKYLRNLLVGIAFYRDEEQRLSKVRVHPGQCLSNMADCQHVIHVDVGP